MFYKLTANLFFLGNKPTLLLKQKVATQTMTKQMLQW